MTDPLTLFPTPPGTISFRPIHYLGGKSRLLEIIERTIDDLVAPTDGPVCDLFTGSGVVAARLARRRDVVAIDIQEYAQVLASAQIAPDAPPIDEFIAQAAARAGEISVSDLVRNEERCLVDAARGEPEGLCEILESGSLARRDKGVLPKSRGTVISRYYGGVYFSYAQAAALDGLAETARRLEKGQRDTALAAVFSVASEIVTSIGNHFAQPVRPRDRDGRIKPAAIRAVIRRRVLDPFALAERTLHHYSTMETPETVSRTIRADYREALDSLTGIAAVYADPPYTRDHYSRFYHVLETIARGDEPAISNVTARGKAELSRGLYRVDRHQSPFCIKSEAPHAFAELFERVHALECPLVLSYSPYVEGGHPRLMTVDQIEALAAEYFASVEVRSAGKLTHSKFNASRMRLQGADEAEVLIVCQR